MTATPSVSPFLWFDGQAREAAEFYVSVFPDGRMLPASEVPGGPAEGSGLVEFEIGGQRFAAVDGGPMYKFTPAVSFVVACDSQAELDYFWEKLSEDGAPGRCGWLEDRFGLSWQVVPAALSELMEADPTAVMEALLTMGKIDIELLRLASLGESAADR